VDQLCTLLIPSGSGYSAENLYKQLKVNEKSISRYWRKEQQVRTEEPSVKVGPTLHIPLPDVPPLPPLVVTPTASVQEEQPKEIMPVPTFANLANICKDQAKLVFVLRHINALSQDKSIKNRDEFVTILRGKCKWEKFLLRYCSRVLNELMKNDFVQSKVGSGDKSIGFTLTFKGFEVIGVTPPPELLGKLKKKKSVAEPLDFVKLLIAGRGKAQELADVGARLESNTAREANLREEIRKLEAEIARIQEENRQIVSVINNTSEAHGTFARLMELITPLPESVQCR
jgi:hypothetical protein